jgi:hypothetical protein
MGIGADDRMAYWCLVLLLLANWMNRGEDAIIYRAGLSNEARSLALRLWDKPNNFAHIRSSRQLEKERGPPSYDAYHSI